MKLILKPLLFILLSFTISLGLAQKKSVKSNYEKGLSKIKKEDYLGAVADLTNAIKENPNNAAAYSKRAFAKGFLQDHYGALTDYNQSLELDPSDAQTYSNRAISRLNTSDKTGACEDWDKAIELGFEEAELMKEEFCQ